MAFPRRSAARPLLAILLLVAAASTTYAVEPGWRWFETPATGKYAMRYIPASLDQGAAAPVVVFLHGSGANPTHWDDFVENEAETAGCVLVLPRSYLLEGWGHSQDPATIDNALEIVGEELRIDRARVAVAGHSSGGAYACWLALATDSHYSAVFSMSAPFVTIAEVADARYIAPVRMYYGTDDPNYIGGSYTSYLAQWLRLGVEWQEDVRSGFGHNTWPDDVIENGFLFLVGHEYPLPPPRWRRGAIRRVVPR